MCGDGCRYYRELEGSNSEFHRSRLMQKMMCNSSSQCRIEPLPYLGVTSWANVNFIGTGGVHLRQRNCVIRMTVPAKWCMVSGPLNDFAKDGDGLRSCQSERELKWLWYIDHTRPGVVWNLDHNPLCHIWCGYVPFLVFQVLQKAREVRILTSTAWNPLCHNHDNWYRCG